jgi:hypothetical protein
MIKKTFKVNEIEIGTEKTGGCFTDSSYIVLAIPSYKEKIRIKDEVAKLQAGDDIGNFELISAMVVEVSCESVDGDLISDFDNLMCYRDGTVVVKFISDMMVHGFVPKKT